MEINNISKILEKERQRYLEKKIKEYLEKGFSKNEAINKANQSWRSHIGTEIQKVIYNLLEKDLKPLNLKLTTDMILRKKVLSKELELVKRMLGISYGEYLFLPDADIIIYKAHRNNVKILAVISVKNSFRERGFEKNILEIKTKRITCYFKHKGIFSNA